MKSQVCVVVWPDYYNGGCLDTTAKAIGKKHEQKSGLSRNNEFRIIDGINQVFWTKAVESVIV